MCLSHCNKSKKEFNRPAGVIDFENANATCMVASTLGGSWQLAVTQSYIFQRLVAFMLGWRIGLTR
jgi:hypothetical protein